MQAVAQPKIPAGLRSYRRHWLIRFLCAPIYTVLFVIGTFNGTVVPESRSPGFKRLERGRLVLDALSGGLRARFVEIDSGEFVFRLLAKNYGVPIRWALDDDHVLIIPADDYDLVRDRQVSSADIVEATTGRYSFRKDWVSIETREGGFVMLTKRSAFPAQVPA